MVFSIGDMHSAQFAMIHQKCILDSTDAHTSSSPEINVCSKLSFSEHLWTCSSLSFIPIGHLIMKIPSIVRMLLIFDIWCPKNSLDFK